MSFKADRIKGFRNSEHERCFKGSPEEYIRLRAKKHRTKYNDEKQAQVLDKLADEVEMLRRAYNDTSEDKYEFNERIGNAH